MSTFLHYIHCKDALLDCSAPGGERCESLTWVDEIHHDIAYHTVITVPEIELDVRITTDTPYLTLTNELRGVYCEDLGENWPRYNGATLYLNYKGSLRKDLIINMSTCPNLCIKT